MEWISGGGDGDPLRQNNRGQKRGKAKESVAARRGAAPLSFFPIIFCPSVSVRVVGNEPLSRVSGQVVIHPWKCPTSYDFITAIAGVAQR